MHLISLQIVANSGKYGQKDFKVHPKIPRKKIGESKQKIEFVQRETIRRLCHKASMNSVTRIPKKARTQMRHNNIVIVVQKNAHRHIVAP